MVYEKFVVRVADFARLWYYRCGRIYAHEKRAENTTTAAASINYGIINVWIINLTLGGWQ